MAKNTDPGPDPLDAGGTGLTDSGGMPLFGLDSYEWAVRRLLANGYVCAPVSAMPDHDLSDEHRVLYLRHDIDLFPADALDMARREADLGVVATYYVLLTGPYDPDDDGSSAVVKQLAEYGHEVGLHYDLDRYPDAPRDAETKLDTDVRRLEQIAGVEVTTVSMHQPGLGGGDVFRTHDRYVHPHDPRRTRPIAYVSDSCRGWRDDSLVRAFGAEAPGRLMWLTHPELYQDPTISERERYLDSILLPRATTATHAYFDDEVRHIWRTAEGARLHDRRIGLR